MLLGTTTSTFNAPPGAATYVSVSRVSEIVAILKEILPDAYVNMLAELYAESQPHIDPDLCVCPELYLDMGRYLHIELYLGAKSFLLVRSFV